MKRKAISKKDRFEVFKRDKFTCQYCGRKAPEVVLVIDHITPVAEGGPNTLLNYVTACIECNQGKGARQLNDDAVVAKQRAQMDELADRMEQIRLMADWQNELARVDDEAVNLLADMWSRHAINWRLNECGKKLLMKSYKRFGFEEVAEAMRIAATQYLIATPVTKEAFKHAFSKINGICVVRQKRQRDPEAGRPYYICGILAKRFPNVSDSAYWCVIREARSNGRSWDEIQGAACNADYWRQFAEILD
jgi:hypothetical protein